MHKALTCLDLEIVREPDTKPGREQAYVEKVPKLVDRFYANGFAIENYEAVLLKHGIEAWALEPDCYSDLNIDQMDETTILALLTALIKKEEAVEGNFLAACVRSELIDSALGKLEALDWENRKIPQWIEQAADKALSDLEQLPKDAEADPYGAILPYLEYIDKEGRTKIRGLSTQDEFDIVDALRRKAKDHGLYLDSSAYDNMRIGLPINTPFRVCRVKVGSKGPETIFSFSIIGPHFIQVSFALLRYADSIESEYCPIDLNSSKRIAEPTSQQLNTLYECIKDANVRNWAEDYSSLTLDGWDWSLMVDSNDLTITSHGSNAFPTSFKELALCIADTFDCSDFKTIIESMDL